MPSLRAGEQPAIPSAVVLHCHCLPSTAPANRSGESDADGIEIEGVELAAKDIGRGKGRGRTKAQKLMEKRNASMGDEAQTLAAAAVGGADVLAEQQAAAAATSYRQQFRGRAPVLFVPDHAGSRLARREAGDMGYDTATEVFPGGKRPQISLPMAWVGNHQEADGLTADAVLTGKYKSFLKWAKSEAGGKENLFTFPYDWRRDYGESTQLLAEVRATS